MNMLWSAKNNVFIPVLMRQQYETAGWDLSDCNEASSELVVKYMGQAPVGKMRISGSNSLPQWGDIPENPAENQQSTDK
ncbi:phage tail protein [Pantoea sp. Bo_7]|uniref:phage tail protein n=1 Tax=unclassified Pantoea TaxID=2630326 RepID=UPI0012318DE7|nr:MULTISPECIES: phage tail protein [unclassified Pantoea]KAA6046645.1 phage tail protein [Pantoea sp. Bo_7]KAA6091874.1 phage tail protein [Pantoea sp. Bo_10]